MRVIGEKARSIFTLSSGCLCAEKARSQVKKVMIIVCVLGLVEYKYNYVYCYVNVETLQNISSTIQLFMEFVWLLMSNCFVFQKIT